MTDSRQMSLSKAQDEGRLAELGYTQELRREWGLLHNFGQIAVTTGIDFGLANLISITAVVTNGYHATAGKTLGILAVVLVSHVAVNLISIHRLRYMIYTSIFLNTLGIFCLIVAVLAKAKTHQTARFTFGKFFDGTGIDGNPGWSVRAAPAYVAACGVLMSQYTILGYDASAHLCEETRKAVRDAPIGLLSAIAASACIGFFVIVGLLFSIQDFETVRSSPLPVLQILTDACGQGGGLVLMVLIMLCVWHCGLFSLTSNSRMMFAFARDGGIPHMLHIIDSHFKCPIRTVIFGASCSFLLALPVLGSQVAFNGTTSIATIGLYISYGIPVLLTLVYPQNFKRGPFTLGIASKPIALVACLWIGFVTIVFCLPTINPVTSQTLNYTPVALGIVTIFAFGSWHLWAHRWFTGRCRNHCRICIRQLDFLGEHMVDAIDTNGSQGQHNHSHRLTSNESSAGMPGSKK
ncbi:MAG: hypothetical protein Q9219_004666 [cf. Caloplaca sp. 3 TL-2023]